MTISIEQLISRKHISCQNKKLLYQRLRLKEQILLMIKEKKQTTKVMMRTIKKRKRCRML